MRMRFTVLACGNDCTGRPSDDMARIVMVIGFMRQTMTHIDTGRCDGDCQRDEDAYERGGLELHERSNIAGAVTCARYSHFFQRRNASNENPIPNWIAIRIQKP